MTHNFYGYFVGWSKTTPRRLTDGGVGHSRGCDVTNEGKITRQPIAGRDSFSIISTTGSFTERTFNQNAGINFNYKQTQGFYEFSGSFICKKKGIYGIGVSDLLSNGIVGEQCKNANFSMTVTNTDKHLFLNQYALNVNPNDPELVKRGYAFRVQ